MSLYGCWAYYWLQDLKNAKSIADWIAWAEPQYDFNPMIDEWCREAPKELDFDHEAGMLWSHGIFISVLFYGLVIGKQVIVFYYFQWFSKLILDFHYTMLL